MLLKRLNTLRVYIILRKSNKNLSIDTASSYDIDNKYLYYDSDEKTFLIKTKSFGTLSMRPPSIGIMQHMTGYIKERQEENVEIDQSVLQIMPYLISEWRGFDKKKIFEFEMEMNGWSNKKYSLIYKLAQAFF